MDSLPNAGPVLKDRLLTDGMTANTNQQSSHLSEDFPVNAEHSYSLGGSTSSSTFGSDGDSMPESPLSLDDGKRFFHVSKTHNFLFIVLVISKLSSGEQ